jgi:hypothetical protein
MLSQQRPSEDSEDKDEQGPRRRRNDEDDEEQKPRRRHADIDEIDIDEDDIKEFARRHDIKPEDFDAFE